MQLQSKVVHKNVVFLIKIEKKSVFHLQISFIFNPLADLNQRIFDTSNGLLIVYSDAFRCSGDCLVLNATIYREQPKTYSDLNVMFPFRNFNFF